MTTLESIKDAIAELQAKLPPPPTEEQYRWAKARGFPGYPGFRVAPDVLTYLAREFPAPVVSSPFCLPPDPLFGVPVVADATLPPGTVLSAERLWELEQRLANTYLNTFGL